MFYSIDGGGRVRIIDNDVGVMPIPDCLLILLNLLHPHTIFEMLNFLLAVLDGEAVWNSLLEHART